MKIQSVSQNKFIKTALVAASLACTTYPAYADKKPQRDEFIKTQQDVKTDIKFIPAFLMESPRLHLADEIVYPALIIDTKSNTLYHYNLNTELENTYELTTAPKTKKNPVGLNIVRNVLKSKNGNTVVIIEELDILTGKLDPNTIKFITNKSNKSLETKDVIYLENDVINAITQELEPEQYIWIR